MKICRLLLITLKNLVNTCQKSGLAGVTLGSWSGYFVENSNKGQNGK